MAEWARDNGLAEFQIWSVSDIETMLMQPKNDHIAASFDIEDRLKKSVQFRDYLIQAWFSSNIHVNYYDFPGTVEIQSRTFKSVEASLANGRRAGSARR